jgi:hypothetical protein
VWITDLLFLECDNVAGSMTITGGAGGDVINGTGNGGGVYESSGVYVWARAHMVVGDGKGDITVVGGRGGSVYAENTPNSLGYGGSSSYVYFGLYDSSSLTAGDVLLVGSSMGNATVNGSAPAPPPSPVLVRSVSESTASSRHATKVPPRPLAFAGEVTDGSSCGYGGPVSDSWRLICTPLRTPVRRPPQDDGA